ncbi:ComF family protein [Streptomyces sp. NPDC102274]|uniref:ComF family protein n=1 Tax=Streptomyces sp. NPDC102274 TaxID=3366151 RepID=UPI00380A38B7
MMQAAWTEDRFDRWPLPPPNRPVLVKTRQTEKSASSRPTWQEKMAAAKSHADALELCASVNGKRLLLVDDVFTTGAQFVTVSRFLIEKGGAADVSGLVLARTPW